MSKFWRMVLNPKRPKTPFGVEPRTSNLECPNPNVQTPNVQKPRTSIFGRLRLNPQRLTPNVQTSNIRQSPLPPLSRPISWLMIWIFVSFCLFFNLSGFWFHHEYGGRVPNAYTLQVSLRFCQVWQVLDFSSASGASGCANAGKTFPNIKFLAGNSTRTAHSVCVANDMN